MQAFLDALELGRVEHGGHQDGTVVDLRDASHRTLYLVGDIHARPVRITEILRHVDLDNDVLVFLGDLFHREQAERAGEMESSLETLQLIANLKTLHPQNVYVLLGNHEFTRTDRCKHGYFQGMLFRQALERAGLIDLYERFLERSPLVVIHPRCVGVHAAPCTGIASLEELKRLPITDAAQLHPAVVQLTCNRHIRWSPWGQKAYTDHDVDDFLQLCGAPGTHLFTGHTPLCRETGWHWPMGPRNTVIFAAGRELGFVKVTSDGYQLVRLGRAPKGVEEIVPQRLPPINQTEGELYRDVLYRLHAPITIELNAEDTLSLRHYRHLSPASQAYYPLGYYLVGIESRQEVLKLKRDQTLLVGGSPLCDGVRFSRLTHHEELLLTQWEEGTFGIRPLRDGLRLRRA